MDIRQRAIVDQFMKKAHPLQDAETNIQIMKDFAEIADQSLKIVDCSLYSFELFHSNIDII